MNLLVIIPMVVLLPLVYARNMSEAARLRRALGNVDLHNEQFCVDISQYGDVTWVEEEAQECSTTFVKKCVEKQENVCADVVETKCDVVPYTVCTMGQAGTQILD